jgi:hypothetical protein
VFHIRNSFLDRELLLTIKLQNKRFLEINLKSWKICGSHHDLVNRYRTSVLEMTMNMFQMTGSRNQVMAYTHVRKLLYGQQVISLDDARDGVSALVAITSCCLSVSSQSRREIQILLDYCLLCKRSREANPGKLLLIKNNCNWPLKYQKRDISHTISSCPKV